MDTLGVGHRQDMGNATMPEEARSLTTMQRIAQAGEKIYAEKYKAVYEREHSGSFVVIDVTDGEAYLGSSPEAALGNGRKAAPNGIFHLIRVGSPGAFKISRMGTARASWLF